MKITAFDELYPTLLGTTGSLLGASTGSNGAFGGDVVGEWGDLSVVGLRQRVSLASNMGDNTVGTVLTTIQSSPWTATFAVPSNSGGNFELYNEGGDPLVHAHGNFGAAETIDPTLGNVHTGTLDADTSVTLSATSGTAGTLLLWLTQDGTGGRDITWVGGVSEIGTPDTAAGTTNLAVATTKDSGATWVVAWVGSSSPAAEDVTFDPAGLTYTDATDVQEAIEDHDAAIADVAADVAALEANPPLSHVHVAYETHTADGSTTTFTLDQFYEPGSVMAWNRSTGVLLGVTEVLPDQATISAAGSAGNLIDFHYAASVI